MRFAWLSLALACHRQDDGRSNDTDRPIPITEDTDASVQLPTPEEASVTLFQTRAWIGRNKDVTALGAVFTETLRGVENLTQCIAYPDTFCAAELPTVVDDFVPLDAFFDELLDDLATRQVGPEISLGPYTAPGVVAQGLKVYFTEELPTEVLPQEPLTLEIGGGEWSAFTAADAIVPPAPIRVQQPDPSVLNTWTATEPIALRWTAEPGAGDVYLAALTPVERRLYLLEDDGEFDLDLSGLGLANGDEIELSLGRWRRAVLEHPERHTISVQSQFDQWMRGKWRDVGDRVHVVPGDQCADTVDVEPLGAGSYWGDISKYVNDKNPPCVRANGEEGIFRIEVAPDEAVTAHYLLPEDDAVMYFLTDCVDDATCASEVDALGPGNPETATWVNGADEVASVYLVLDAQGLANPISDLFFLDVTKSPFTADAFVNTCAEAMVQGPLAEGAFAGDLAFGVDILDPNGACLQGSAPGAEGIAQFTVAPGERLTANVSMAGSNPILYLLYNCANIDSCVMAVDQRSDDQEILVYTNTAGYSENLYLVLDAADATGHYALDLSIE